MENALCLKASSGLLPGNIKRGQNEVKPLFIKLLMVCPQKTNCLYFTYGKRQRMILCLLPYHSIF